MSYPWKQWIKGYEPEPDYSHPDPQTAEMFRQYTKKPGNDFAQITPAEAQALTGIRTNPLPQNYGELGKQIKDGADAAVPENAKRVIKGLSDIPGTRIIKNTRMAPMLNMPDLEKDYLEKLNKKRLIS